jgi:hypothetical protein
MLRAATVGIRLIDVNPSDHSDSARPADIHFGEPLQNLQASKLKLQIISKLQSAAAGVSGRV